MGSGQWTSGTELTTGQAAVHRAVPLQRAALYVRLMLWVMRVVGILPTGCLGMTAMTSPSAFFWVCG